MAGTSGSDSPSFRCDSGKPPTSSGPRRGSHSSNSRSWSPTAGPTAPASGSPCSRSRRSPSSRSRGWRAAQGSRQASSCSTSSPSSSSTTAFTTSPRRGLNGLSLGSVYALGAVGLTLVYGILKLVNFAHGDFLTFGAYMAFVVNVTWGAAARPRRSCFAIVGHRGARAAASSAPCGGRCAHAAPGCCSCC